MLEQTAPFRAPRTRSRAITPGKTAIRARLDRLERVSYPDATCAQEVAIYLRCKRPLAIRFGEPRKTVDCRSAHRKGIPHPAALSEIPDPVPVRLPCPPASLPLATQLREVAPRPRFPLSSHRPQLPRKRHQSPWLKNLHRYTVFLRGQNAAVEITRDRPGWGLPQVAEGAGDFPGISPTISDLIPLSNDWHYRDSGSINC